MASGAAIVNAATIGSGPQRGHNLPVDNMPKVEATVRGVLRVAVSSSFGVREVIPRLPDFLDRHPELRVDLLVSDVRQD
ncbi:LysR substrate-binding domain-containing protein, partial [Klebsiella pneumoniae]